MNRSCVIKLSVLCASLFIINGCAYYKAMDIQKQRQAIIATNLEQESNITKVQEAEKIQLEKEIISFQSEVSNLDKEISKIKAKTKKARFDNMKKARNEYNKQLKILTDKKMVLQNDINKKKAIIAIL
ncbi:hypothetical protein VXS02_02895 [Photobacterium piscicola]|uniref:hypothetical protein n=1 Tax=Photobacterium piscicola TaxID=1378299 RepID=UPI002E185143|nr:hypothetical protein [Photobacterium piscicola]MEC6881283.1 hypothetical protein [Photobacterium piscicola]